jgi:hypothetical protein
MTKNVSTIIVETLVAAGDRRCYGIVGDTINHFTDAVRRSDLRWIHVRHEEVGALVRTLKAPVVHSSRAKEFIEPENPFNVGMTGILGNLAGLEAIERAMIAYPLHIFSLFSVIPGIDCCIQSAEKQSQVPTFHHGYSSRQLLNWAAQPTLWLSLNHSANRQNIQDRDRYRYRQGYGQACPR